MRPVLKLPRRFSTAGLGIGTDADDALGLQGGDDGLQMSITGLVERIGLGGGEFIGREIFATGLDEDERAVIGHEVLAEEVFGCAEFGCEMAPEASAAHFGLRAVKTEHGAFGMLTRWFAHRFADFHPVTHGGDLAKGHAGLRHAEGAGIHADEDDFFAATAKAGEVGGVRGPGVIERLIDEIDRWGEFQRAQGLAEGFGGVNERVGGHAGASGSGGGGRQPGRRALTHPGAWPK